MGATKQAQRIPSTKTLVPPDEPLCVRSLFVMGLRVQLKKPAKRNPNFGSPFKPTPVLPSNSSGLFIGGYEANSIKSTNFGFPSFVFACRATLSPNTVFPLIPVFCSGSCRLLLQIGRPLAL